MTYHLFERIGIELEYMIVDRDTMRVAPLTDKVLEEVNGHITNEVAMGEISWSNELALHVIELKTTEPALSLENLDTLFHANIRHINTILKKYNACLMGGPMHPFMDPIKEIRLWPHDYSPIYSAFDRIFSCKGHGWANLQSMHINLPFANDDEFGRLHAAIRLVLPILPALSAGSPFADGKLTGFQDTRMETYRHNSEKIRSITGDVIPEAVFSRAEYERNILERIYSDLSPYDPEKILQEEWVNARGAIARFERNTIEIRVIDVQETPFADCAIAGIVIEVIKNLVNGQWSSYEYQMSVPGTILVDSFLESIRHGQDARITDSQYLQVFNLGSRPCTMRELWKQLSAKMDIRNRYIKTLLENGTLSSRMIQSAGPDFQQNNLLTLCKSMCCCVDFGEQLHT
ncbi:MAG TPA: glutamate-cysteine ligase family protein [Chitinispirillaceae bacterium]|nr:glutamate-cysteine ligase family protein [Chitinispirillaceae bacterium]